MAVKVTLFLAVLAAVLVGMMLPTPHAPKPHAAQSQFASLETGEN